MAEASRCKAIKVIIGSLIISLGSIRWRLKSLVSGYQPSEIPPFIVRHVVSSRRYSFSFKVGSTIYRLPISMNALIQFPVSDLIP